MREIGLGRENYLMCFVLIEMRLLFLSEGRLKDLGLMEEDDGVFYTEVNLESGIY